MPAVTSDEERESPPLENREGRGGLKSSAASRESKRQRWASQPSPSMLLMALQPLADESMHVPPLDLLSPQNLYVFLAAAT